MRVAIFTDNDFGKVNGVTTTLRAVLEHAPENVSARVYTCESRRVDSPNYLALRSFGIGIPYYSEMKMYWPPFRRFLRWAKDDRIELVHFTTPGPVGLAAMWVAEKLGVPMVGSFHTDLAEYTRLLSGRRWLGDLMQEYMRWPYGKCQRILVPSAATRDMLVRGKIRPEKIRFWRRGVSTERFAPERRSALLRRQWGASESTPVLLYVGRLSKEKALSMIEPLRRLLTERGASHRFVFVGDGPMRQGLQAMCPDAVFTGTLTPDEVAVAMASADLFVFPSRTDTAGNVVLEAQASGLPALVSDAGGPREHVRPDQSGIICHDLLDFARSATALLLDPGRRRRFSEEARRYALGRGWRTALEPLYRSYLESVRASVAPAVAAQPAAAQ